MSQRRAVSGRRSIMIWLAIVLVLVLAIALGAVVFIISPQQQLRQQAQGTVEARQAEVERHYQAGIAFQDVGEWLAAEAEYKQVVMLDADYEDASTRLAEVKVKLAESEATATVDAQAKATAQAEATAQAQANARATRVAAPTATAERLEIHYQKALGYVDMDRWEEAEVELERVFDVNPNYRDVQAKLAEVEIKLVEIRALTPNVTSTPILIETTPPVASEIYLATHDWSWSTTSNEWTTVGDLGIVFTTTHESVLIMSANGHVRSDDEGKWLYASFFVDGKHPVGVQGQYGFLGSWHFYEDNATVWAPCSFTQLAVVEPGFHEVDVRIKAMPGSGTWYINGAAIQVVVMPR